MSYGGVWLIVALAAGLSAAGWYMLIRTRVPIYVQVLVVTVWLVLMLVPAPVPKFPGNYAPAFVVVTFEGLFQSVGAPWQAIKLLLAGVCGSLALVTLIFLFLRRRRSSA